MININVVLIADRIINKNDMSAQTLEQISDEYFYQIYNSIERVVHTVIHYNDLKSFIKNIDKHKNDLVFSIYGGENSRNRLALVPAICEAYGIKFVGPDAYDRIICQDKDISRNIAAKNGMFIPKGKTIYSPQEINNHIFNDFKFPIIAKPLFEGSSIGITESNYCQTRKELEELVSILFSNYNQPILIEEFIPGKEIVTCFVGNNKSIQCFEVIEVYAMDNPNYFDTHLYTGAIKHLDKIKTAHRIITSTIDENTINLLKETFLSFQKMDYMRIDGKLFDNKFYFIEFTPDASLSSHCSFKDIYEYYGKNYDQLIYDIIQNALEDYRTQ